MCAGSEMYEHQVRVQRISWKQEELCSCYASVLTVITPWEEYLRIFFWGQNKMYVFLPVITGISPPPPPIHIPTIRSLLLLIVEDWQKKIKAPVIVMPCNIFQAKPESFSAIRKNVNRGGRKKKKWLIENIKRFLNYFWKETHETGCGGKIILIICIVSQEEKACCVAFTVSAPMEMCAILSGEPHETPPVYVLFPSVRSVPTLAAVLPSAQQ